ncbi:MAG: beta-glucosidase-related glycosidase, partial [Blautia sp.]|nr:beta-glucosidase-related glycosidase [Blautia sp.]
MIRKAQVWRGLSATTACLLAASLTAGGVVSDHRTDIDKFLGTSSSKIVIDGEVDPAEVYTYASDYASTTELVQAMADIGERMSEEGSVLLKNENGTLPLSEEEVGKVSLLGFSSYFPNKGAILGPTAAENHGTDADTVDLVGALKAKGFTINDTLEKLYNSEAMKSIFKSEVATWTGTAEYLNLTAPSVGGVYTDKEPSVADLDAAQGSWKDSIADYPVMILTIGRAGSENADYTPGEAGVNPADGLNQADPLGLSDDERGLIKAAAEAKEANGGKLIV